MHRPVCAVPARGAEADVYPSSTCKPYQTTQRRLAMQSFHLCLLLFFCPFRLIRLWAGKCSQFSDGVLLVFVGVPKSGDNLPCEIGLNQ
eukprot:2432027-Amphidinium_carterae.1